MSTGENPPASLLATGIVRLFPLPNLVMFPHVVQPLHIFEPRYCELLDDALSGDRQIAMVLLQRDWQRDYQQRPAIAPVACLGKIVAHERLPTGRHNILLRGLSRVAIRREVLTERPFRLAEVEVLDDFYAPTGAARRSQSRRRLLQLARKLLPNSEALDDQLTELQGSQASLGMLTDVFSFTLGFSPALKQRLLEESNVDERAGVLIERLAALVAPRNEHQEPPGTSEPPPSFSLN